MNPATTTRVLARLGVAFLATGALVASGAIGAAAAPGDVTITVDDLASARPATGGWFVDSAGSGQTFAVTQDGPGGDTAMKLGVSSTSDKVYVYNTFGPGSRSTDIPALLTGASYDYAGINVNFQVEVIFEPTDVALYGPAGTSRACTPASTWYGWGLTADTDWCYTVLKWEPYVSPGVASWTHVDLSNDTAAQSSTSRGGWVSSKNLGQYVGNVSNGELMSTYLGQMTDYEVTAFAFGVGSGTPGPAAGYLKSYTMGGIEYGFAAVPGAPAPAPAVDTDALLQLIIDDGVDVDADTAAFGAGSGNLDALDVSKPFDAVYSGWSDPSDAFVDVHAYSTASYVGTFPVIGGNVVLTGLDLSALSAGGHHLLMRGQTSGAVAVIAFTAATMQLAATGAEAALASGAALALLVAGGALFVTARRLRATGRS